MLGADLPTLQYFPNVRYDERQFLDSEQRFLIAIYANMRS